MVESGERELSRKERKVSIDDTLAAEASENQRMWKAALTHWIAVVSAAEVF